MKVKEIKEKVKCFCVKHYDAISGIVICGSAIAIAGTYASLGYKIGYRKCYDDYSALLIAQNPDAFLEVQKTLVAYNQNKK